MPLQLRCNHLHVPCNRVDLYTFAVRVGSKDGYSYGKVLRSQLTGGVGLVVRFQITSRMLEGNVEYFNYLGNMITNDAIGTREIESSFAMTKAAVNMNTLFT